MTREKAIQDVDTAMGLICEIQWAMLHDMTHRERANRHEIGAGYKILMGVWCSLLTKKTTLEFYSPCTLECCS